tara:strand:- start:478 stop:1008 length:531 start_codon:yes stop_codon:yes gene_type:complete
MKSDFSVDGRERALFNAFFDKSSKYRKSGFIFARWTLLERVIWQHKPLNTYCHLDGFDFDQFRRTQNAFVGVGRIWMLPEPGTPGNVATAMAIEFDRTHQCVRRALVWVGPLVPRREKAPRVKEFESGNFFSAEKEIGECWQPAFEKDLNGWHINPEFDLSILLMPFSDADLERFA